MSRWRKLVRLNPGIRAIREYMVHVSNSLSSNRMDSNLLKNLINECGIDVLLDVGANVGQFGVDIRRKGFLGKIISFEPNPVAYSQLLGTIENDEDWDAINLGLGAVCEELTLNISRNDGLSSSYLQMMQKHIDLYPNSEFIKESPTKIIRLDDWFSSTNYSNIFLKIDVQGYELEVLKGAPETLRKVKLILVEISLEQLYEGQSSLIEVLKLLKEYDFYVAEILGISRVKGTLVQFDLVAMRHS